MPIFIAVCDGGRACYTGTSLEEMFSEAQDDGWELENIKFFNLGSEIEVELKLVPIISKQISVKKGK